MGLAIQPNSDGSLTITCEGITIVYGGAPAGSVPPKPLPPQPIPQGPTSWPTAFVVREGSRGFAGLETLPAGRRTVQWAGADRARQLRAAIRDVADDTAYHGLARPRIRVVLEAGEAVDVGEIVAAIRRANSPVPVDVELIVPGPAAGDLMYDLDMLKR